MNVFYPLLLLSWVFLLPVLVFSFRRGEKPVGLLVVFGLNLLFTAYEAYMTFVWSKTVTAPIRIDIFAVVIVLVAVNTLTGIGILLPKSSEPGRAKPHPIEKAMGLLLLGICFYAVGGLVMIVREGHHASRTIDRQKQLEFQTMFQDARTVQHYFGDLGSDARGWAGHYAADPTARGWLTRLLINTDGKVWLYFTCDPDAECVYVRGEDASLGRNSSPAVKIQNLKPDVGVWTASLDLKRETADRLDLSLIMDGPSSPNAKLWEPSRTHLVFTRTAPPAFPKAVPAHEDVEYLGVYSNGYLQRDALFVVQMWLWRSGPHVFGRYVRRGWTLGSKADFISAQAVTGTYDAGQNRVAFTVNAQESFQGQFLDAQSLDGQVLWAGRPLESLRLKKKELITGFPYEFAPLTTEKATQDWLEVSSFGKMVSWQVPAAFDPSSW